MAGRSPISVLLDACALLALSRGELPKDSATAFESSPEAHVCVVSPWELAIKVARGKLHLPHPRQEWFRQLTARHDLHELQFDVRVACAAAALPRIHRDPFDRVLVALAQAHDLTVLTWDENIAKYPGVKTVW